jgi:hypothetical protein
MNREELGKMISLIDDDKLAEAAVSRDRRGFRPATRPTVHPAWQKALMTAAVIVLVIAVSMVWTKLEPGLNPTKTTTTIIETTTAGTIKVPRWEDREVFEKYVSGAVIKGTEYQSSVHELDESLIEAKLGSLRLTGHDIYTDKTYAIDAAFYQIRNIDPDCVVAVRYEGCDGYYGFFNANVTFKTLADLINRLDLTEHLKINDLFIRSVWHGDNQKDLLRLEYYRLPDPDIVWDQLFARTDIVNEGEAARDKLGWEVLSISIDYAPAGQSKIGIVLFDNGYLTTNILWSLQSFYIGKEAVLAFTDYVLAKGKLEKSIGLESPVETTSPATGEATTRELPAQTTQATTRQ